MNSLSDSTMHRVRGDRRRWVSVVACAAALSVVSVVTPVAPILGSSVANVFAVDGPPNSFQVVNKSVAPSSGAPNTTFNYSISYSCPGVVAGGTCAAARITDPLPQFIDIDGATRQLTYVSSPGNGHFSPGTVSGSSPNQVITWNATSSLTAGASGILTMSVRVPRGIVPAGSQTITNVATGNLAGVLDDSPVASTTIAASTTNWTFNKTGPATLLINSNGTYSLNVCPATGTGALPSTVTIVDTLPPGTTYNSSSNGGVYANNPDPTVDTISWTINATNRPTPNGSTGCIAVTASVRFVPPASGGDATNLVGEVKSNSATATADTVKSGLLNTTLTGPVTRVTRTKSVSVGGTYVTDGDRVTYSLQLSNNSDAGAGSLDTAVLTDGPLPVQYSLDTITTGTWAWGSAATVEVSPDGTSWTVVASGLTGVTSTTISSGLAGSRWVRWNFTGPIAVSQATSAITLSGTVSGAVVPSTTLANCLASVATQGAASFSSSSQCVNVTLEIPQPHPSITKRVNGASTATLNPGATATYTIAIANNSDATAALVDPTVVDCLPAGLAVASVSAVSGWTRDLAYTNPTCSNAGGTPLRFTYSGSVAANASATTISYTVQANGFEDPDGAIAAPGNYANTASARTTTGSSFGHCVQAGCASTATVTVPVVAQLTSAKEAQGALDSGWTTTASTMPGAGVTWRLTLQNSGNVDVLNPVFIDIFPHVGDTGVLVNNVARNSEFGTYLVSPITATPGWSVEYSASANPCRPEVGGVITGCDTANWTSSPDLTRMPIYQSVKLSYTGIVARGTSAQFAWQSRVPVLDQAYDTADTTSSPYDDIIDCGGSPVTCPKAVNSFAYGTFVDPADLNGASDPGLLRSEPPVVSVAVTSIPQPNIIGNRVFDDIDHDGVQDPAEPGVPNVRVEFFVDVAGVWVAYEPYGYTYTDADGYYLFPDVPDGDFKLRFYLPDSTSYVTLQDVTGVPGDDPASNNSDDDSDLPTMPTGSNLYGNYYDTPAVALGNTVDDEIDNTWDAGVWFPRPHISVAKRLNGSDSGAAPGLELYPGDPAIWTYLVTNSGNTFLSFVALIDVVTASGALDPVPVCNWAASSDPATPAGHLSRGESVTCTFSDVAVAGAYSNTASVAATGTLDPSDPTDPETYGTIERLTDLERNVTASDTGNYAGLTYALGDMVFVDVDSNGVYNPPVDVPVVNGTPVELYDDTDLLVDSTTTLTGRYLFTQLRPGTYYVRIPVAQFEPGGPLFGLGGGPLAELDPNTDMNEAVDHHAIDDSGGVRSSGLLTLSSHVSAGVFVGNEPVGEDTGSIANGVNDARTNQTLDLALGGNHPLVVQTDSACAADTGVLFYRLDYRYFTPSMVGTIEIFPYLPGPDLVWGNGDDLPSNVAVQTIMDVPLNEWVSQPWPGTTTAPREWPGWQLAGGVWVVDHDGLIPKVLVRATVDTSNTAVAVYPAIIGDCDPSPPVASVGNHVWWDVDGDGVEGIGEAGVPNASVVVSWAGLDGTFGTSDDVVHPAVLTDANGNWLLASLPAGDYRVAVTLADSDELVPSHDLDGIGTPGAAFSLIDDENRRDVDFGFVARFALGDLVFNDVDGDGHYDGAIDVVVSGLIVHLTAADGTVLDTSVTDEFGRFAFTGLLPGDHRLVVPAAEFGSGGPVEGWSVGLAGVADPENDADEGVDHNAVAFAGGVRTGVVTLSATLAPSGQFSGDEPGGMTNGTLDLALRAPAAVTIAKQVNTGEGWVESVHVGFLGGVDWQAEITNSGGQTLHAVEVIDVLAPGCATTYSLNGGVLQPGESFTVTCTSSNLVAGFVNTTAVTATDPAGGVVNDSDTASVTVDPPVSAVVLVKYVTDELLAPVNGMLHDANTVPGYYAATGTNVMWVYSVANTGTTPLDITDFDDTNTSPLPVDDFPVMGSMYVSGDTDLDGLLDLDETWWYATTTATVVAAGQTETSATVWAAGTDADGNHLTGVDAVTDTDAADHFGADVGLTVDKTTNGLAASVAPGDFVRMGDLVEWTYVVTNMSNTTLIDVSVTDDPAADISCLGGNPISSLAPGAQVTCTASVASSTVLGQFRNEVTATGTPVDEFGDPVTGPGLTAPVATDSSHFFGWDASIEVVKAVDAVDPAAPSVAEDAQTSPGPIRPQGAEIVWTYRVTNTGFSPLTAIAVVDDDSAAVISCPTAHDPPSAMYTIALLLPGETVVCTATIEVELGQSSTTATASGQPAYPDGSDFTGVAPNLIQWPTDPAGYSAMTSGAVAVGRVVDSDLAHHFGWAAAVSVTKLTNGQSSPDAPGAFIPEGAPITWTYRVTNTGFSPLKDVTVVDDIEGATNCGPADGDIDGDIDLLLPGNANSVTCELTGAAVVADPDPNYANTVVVVGQPAYPGNDPTFDPDAVELAWPANAAAYVPLPMPGSELGGVAAPTVTATATSHYFSAAPGVDLVKTTNDADANSAPGPFIMTGDAVTWEYQITNTGNTDLVEVGVTDDMIAVDAIDCGAGSNIVATIAVGGTATCTATLSAVAGQYANVGTVQAAAVDASGNPLVDPTTGDPVPVLTATDPSHYYGASPAVSILKVVCNLVDGAACDIADDGDWSDESMVQLDGSAVWRITVSNTGNVLLTDVVITDVLEASCDRTFTTIEVAAVRRWTCTTPVVTDPILNTAAVSAIPVDDSGTQLHDADDSSIVLLGEDSALVTPPMNLRLSKTVGAGTVIAGSLVDWTLQVTNDGPGIARDTTVVDTLPHGLAPVDLPAGVVYDEATRQLRWQLGTMNPGDVVTLHYTTQVFLGSRGDLTNVATVSSSSALAEIVSTDNFDRATVNVAGAGGALPSTGIGWLMVLLLLALGFWATGLGVTGSVKRR